MAENEDLFLTPSEWHDRLRPYWEMSLSPIIPHLLCCLPHPVSSDGAYRAWDTKRAKKFNRCVAQLAKWQTADLGELLLAAHEISTQIADRLPEHVNDLPRGYTLVRSCSWRVLSLDGTLYSSVGREVADREQLARLFHDLMNGWLKEIDHTIASASDNSGYYVNSQDGVL